VSDQTQQTPEWGTPPTDPQPPQPPKPKRQFLVTKIAAGVAAGIFLFIVGMTALIAIAISGGGSTSDKQATSAAPATTQFASPASTPTDQAPVDETPTTQPAEIGKAGDTFTATANDGSGADFTVTKITTSTVDRGTISPNDSSFWDHPTNGLYLIVRLTVKGTSGSFDINPAEFVVIGPDGQTYDDQTYSETWGQSLPSTNVHQGQTRRGVIVFDVRAKHGQVAYTPNFDGDPIAIWSY
jgi:hypothetical protein